jgi:hypothetical protein
MTTRLPSSKEYRLVISKLYESNMPNNRGPLSNSANSSSLEPSDIPNAEPSLPHVITQSFIIPESISHMSITRTHQGITILKLLCTLISSKSVIRIPHTILNSQRLVGRNPTATKQEEGLFRYQPVIKFNPKIMLNYKHKLVGLKYITTSPALLESTSLIFTYRVNMFRTKVAPSFAFHILRKAFNKLSLVVTVLALGVRVAVLAPIVGSPVAFGLELVLNLLQVRKKQINGRCVMS